tara:strand:- start:239 stop:517 length:279 start_codon:yes stop_codon:yes gene_type:complete
MPNVGGKQFPYTAQGVRNAQDYSDISGIPINSTYRHGGPIDIYGEGGRVKKKRKKPKPDPKRMGSAKPIVIANVAKKGIDGKSRVKTKTKYC